MEAAMALGPDDWEVPVRAQPDPDDYAFDLDRALDAVVGLTARVPVDAYTAGTLGTERTGNGVVIRDDGIVLTIGYLITEAEEARQLRGAAGRALGLTPAPTAVRHRIAVPSTVIASAAKQSMVPLMRADGLLRRLRLLAMTVREAADSTLGRPRRYRQPIDGTGGRR
ncbi:hypothetical protein P409_17405, partial [Inquilinus limosus MP06]